MLHWQNMWHMSTTGSISHYSVCFCHVKGELFYHRNCILFLRDFFMSILSPIKRKVNCQLVYTRSCFVTFFLKDRDQNWNQLWKSIVLKSHIFCIKVIKSKVNQIEIKQEHYSAFKLTRAHQAYLLDVFGNLLCLYMYILFFGVI